MFNSQLHSTGPAPAYAYESDSEDEEWADDPLDPSLGSLTLSKTSSPTLTPEFVWSPTSPTSHPSEQPRLLFLLGHAGQLIAAGLPSKPITATLTVSGGRVQAYYFRDLSTVYLPSSVPLPLQHSLASALLRTLRPTSVTIVSSYPSPTYLPPWPASQPSPPPIRFLLGQESETESNRLEADGFARFEIPNLIQGLDAALILQANLLGLTGSVKTFLLPSVSKTSVMSRVAVRAPPSAYDFSPGAGRMTSCPILLDPTDRSIERLGKTLTIGCRKWGVERNVMERRELEEIFESLDRDAIGDGHGDVEKKSSTGTLQSMYI